MNNIYQNLINIKNKIVDVFFSDSSEKDTSKLNNSYEGNMNLLSLSLARSGKSYDFQNSLDPIIEFNKLQNKQTAKKEDIKDNYMKEELEDLIVDSKSFLNDLNSFLFVYAHSLSSSKDGLNLAISNNGEVVSISNKERLQHIYCIGSTGSGKSQAILSYVTSDLMNQRGGLLIDPFGGLFEDLSRFCLYYNELKEKLQSIQLQISKYFLKYNNKILGNKRLLKKNNINYEKLQILEKVLAQNIDEILPPINYKLVDLNPDTNKSKSYKINPFEIRPGQTVEDIFEVLWKTIQRHMGTSLGETPRAEYVIKCIFVWAICKSKILSEIPQIIAEFQSYSGQAQKNCKKIPNDLFKELEEYNEPITKSVIEYLKTFLFRLDNKRFGEIIESSLNRIQYFLDSITCSQFFNAETTTLDLETIINNTEQNREFIICKVPKHKKGAKIIATYLLTKIDSIIFNRTDEQKKLLFFTYVDEFHNFADAEIIKRFAEVRQFGLAWFVANQTYSQLKEIDKDGLLLDTLLGNTFCKLVFNVGLENDAIKIVENSFEVTGQLQKFTYATSTSMTTVNGYTDTNGSSHSESTTNTNGSSYSTSQNIASTYSIGNSINQGYSSAITNSSGNSGKTDKDNYKIISVSSSNNEGSSKQKSESKVSNQNEGSSSSEGNTNTNSQSVSNGVSEAFQVSHAIAKSISKGEGNTTTVSSYSIQEERLFLAQEIKKLRQRDLFVCFKGLTTIKGISLDSLNIQLEPDENFQKYLGSKIYNFIEAPTQLCIENEDIIESKLDSQSSEEIEEMPNHPFEDLL